MHIPKLLKYVFYVHKLSVNIQFDHTDIVWEMRASKRWFFMKLKTAQKLYKTVKLISSIQVYNKYK